MVLSLLWGVQSQNELAVFERLISTPRSYKNSLMSGTVQSFL